ncbi:MAG: serine hydroxymethyltransferase [Candidatus Thermoplasmatota archaeon]|jgi:glycine hydroxymethyltransferase|nr:serine hydroxymethyltransferase [Candidatus Thermoplasmatota archaeon]
MALSDAIWFRQKAEEHNNLFRHSIPLIASENLISPITKEMIVSDLNNRYAEGLPGHRYYQGNRIVDEIETRTEQLMKTLFNSKQADVRPISGTNANQALVFALGEPGDKILSPSLDSGAHISSAEFGAVGMRGLKSSHMSFDFNEMKIDVDETRKIILSEKPKITLFGFSVFLFPAPIKELKNDLDEVGSKIWYDGAHVLGLIAGKRFQDPLREGADLITGSTHKTFPGPQHGAILGNTDDETWKKVRRGVFPGVLSNHHLGMMAGLGVTASEMLEFGETYADSVITNAKTLAQELHSLGFNVLAEKSGFTESHTILVDVKGNGGGKYVAETLEANGIILNKNMIPGDSNKKAQDPSGIRIGTQEVTRIGMGRSEMVHVANLIYSALNGKDVREDVRDLKEQFQEVKYCYGKETAYNFLQLYR